MLSFEEMSARRDFYTKIFGKNRLENDVMIDRYLWPIEAYGKKISWLEERGFKDPRKMIASFPAILSYTFDNIDGKIVGLKDRGFKDPQKMIASLPTIFSLSFENIDNKIAGLEERGFKDQQKMIAS